MKYLIVIADGMADYPIESLGGKTPLEYIDKPSMDFLAKNGFCGMVKTVPDGMSPGSDIANLSIFGFDPKKYFTGRAPLEAVSIGVNMNSQDIAFRCNLVTFREENGLKVMDDYSAGHISTDEAEKYINFINDKIKLAGISFHKGVSYRHLMIWKDGKDDLDLTPPHDIPDRPIDDYLPKGDGADFIKGIMKISQEVLKDCHLNKERKKNGKKEVSSIWLWGQGRKPSLQSFEEKFGLKGGVISAVDLIRGIGILAGLKPIKVEGITGYIDTNFEGKADSAVEVLKKEDICFVHIEACDEASHEGSLEKKMLGIEYIDRRFLKRVLDGLSDLDDYRILLCIDHPTPVKKKVHVADKVPFVIYEKNKKLNGVASFCERLCDERGFYIEEGYLLINTLINGDYHE
ncbi:MAG: cofactor-independent phosphoglycerate mutase [Proteobacteria bacterium]|nr:cofactor-independent phosphoglycerate mutase [Pseudomonadota bacterium]